LSGRSQERFSPQEGQIVEADTVGRVRKQIDQLEQELERARQKLLQAQEVRAKAISGEFLQFGLVERTDEELFGALDYLSRATPEQWAGWSRDGARFLKNRAKTGRRQKLGDAGKSSAAQTQNRDKPDRAAGENPADLAGSA
jgi:hypothetical protein